MPPRRQLKELFSAKFKIGKNIMNNLFYIYINVNLVIVFLNNNNIV